MLTNLVTHHWFCILLSDTTHFFSDFVYIQYRIYTSYWISSISHQNDLINPLAVHE